MNEIMLSSEAMPHALQADFLITPVSFVHADRTVDFNVLIYVAAGRISVSEDGEDYDVNSGELLILKSGVHHYGSKKIPSGTAWYYVHFRLEDNEGKAVAVPKKLSGLNGSIIEEKILRLCELFRGQEESVRWRVNSSLFDLLTECAFYTVRTEKTLSDRAADFLSEHSREPFSSKALEQYFYLSYKYIASVFKRDKGVTLQKFHNSLRMREAGRLLRSTLMTVGEVSANLGFADALYFSRCFRDYFGKSPSDYRRNILHVVI